MRGYVLCASPRTGSTLLCAMLRASGVAGWPESWFRAEDRDAYAVAWGICDAAGRYGWADYVDAALRAGRGANGVFGLRLMWATLLDIEQDLPGLGPLQFIWLRRRDKVAQAISRHRAEVSGTWHLGFEEAAEPREPGYDFDRIAHWLAEAEADDAGWQGWFAAQGVQPLELTYEDLAAAPGATAQAVLAHLGLTSDAPLTVGNRRMADATSDLWAARFRADLADVTAGG